MDKQRRALTEKNAAPTALMKKIPIEKMQQIRDSKRRIFKSHETRL
ncbi:hypothetical protein [Gracilibacillus sp. YIM 98692]|nr:hypothetical protein [Gracilibacillus sp. YIM 98692]